MLLLRLPHLKDEVKVGEGGRMKRGGGDKQRKMLGARERGREDEREIKGETEGTEVQESGERYVSLESKITIGLALF